MKGMDLFCRTPASTAICSSLDQKAMVLHGTKNADQQTPRLIDWRKPATINSSSRPLSKPKSHNHQNSRKSSSSLTDLTTPPGSSRYLLNDAAFFDLLSSDFDQPPELCSIDSTSRQPVKKDGSPVLKPSAVSHEQVVELKVSLHCKGCEGKVRKHISRMEGVRSFSIDFSTKKVTVIGNVTPLGVLASVSKVKNAQFWPSPPSSSSVII